MFGLSGIERTGTCAALILLLLPGQPAPIEQYQPAVILEATPGGVPTITPGPTAAATAVVEPTPGQVNPWAYTLEDQNEPEYLALRTQLGTFRVLPHYETWECGFLLANMNVLVLDWGTTEFTLRPDGSGWIPHCVVTVTAQVDDYPCYVNEEGDCDVRAENE